MRRLLLTCSLALTALATSLTVSSAALAAEVGVPLRHANVNLSDTGSLQRGAKYFVNYCLSCHSVSYMRYERMADDLDISHEILESNLMFAASKKGALMKAAMTQEQGKEYFGAAPPDLSVIARVKSPDYLYTYLTGFYPDESTATGWNNIVYPQVAMPHVMWQEQGLQEPIKPEGEGKGADAHSTAPIAFNQLQAGQMTPTEFDVAMADLTSFLVYVAEPAKLKRYTMGVWVLMFLSVLLVLTWLLKKEYWRDVH